jgi:hypothetical protein
MRKYNFNIKNIKKAKNIILIVLFVLPFLDVVLSGST